MRNCRTSDHVCGLNIYSFENEMKPLYSHHISEDPIHENDDYVNYFGHHAPWFYIGGYGSEIVDGEKSWVFDYISSTEELYHKCRFVCKTPGLSLNAII